MRNVQRRSQLQRIGSIVLLLQSKQLSKKDLILALHSKFHKEFCQSQIEKDFFYVKNGF